MPVYQQDDPRNVFYTDFPMRFVIIDGLNGAGHAEAINWCVEQFGLSATSSTPDSVWLIGLASISFRDASAATAFKMRWC